MFTEEVMMFHKQYYSLEEAAQKLGVDVETIMHEAIAGNIDISVRRDWNYTMLKMQKGKLAFKGASQQKNCMTEGSEWIALSKYTISAIYRGDDVYIYSDNLLKDKERERYSVDYDSVNWLQYNSSDANISRKALVALKTAQAKTYKYLSVSIDQVIFSERETIKLEQYNLIISHTELTRLLALKAEHDGKPTDEQLQQQLNAAKARIAELEAMQAQPVPHNQPNELQQPYPCLQPIADIIEAFEHNPDFVKYGQGIQQQIIEDWLFSKHKLTRDKARHIKALITEHYNITTTR
jgi:hypothetical protein